MISGVSAEHMKHYHGASVTVWAVRTALQTLCTRSLIVSGHIEAFVSTVFTLKFDVKYCRFAGLSVYICHQVRSTFCYRGCRPSPSQVRV